MSRTVTSFSQEIFKAVLAEYQKLLKLPYSAERDREIDRIRAKFLDVALYRTLEASDPEAAFWTCYEMIYGDAPKKIPMGEIIALLRGGVQGGHVASCWLLGAIFSNWGGRTPDEFISYRKGNLLVARAARKGYCPAMTSMLTHYRAQLSNSGYYSRKAYRLAQLLAEKDYPSGYLYLGECALQSDEPGPKGAALATGYFEKALKSLPRLDFVEQYLEGRIKLKLGIRYYEAGRQDEGIALIREADQYEWEARVWLTDHGIPVPEDQEAPMRETTDRAAEEDPYENLYASSPERSEVQVIRLKKPFSFQLRQEKELEEKKNREFSAQELEIILRPLDDLIGLDAVKKQVRELVQYAQVIRRRRQAGLSTSSLSLHMVFSGNPGTGKTTVARILGRIMADLGFLKSGHVVEVDRSGLVGEYIGETAQKTRKAANNARGGILFIDEAHALIHPHERDYGWEVADTLVKVMEDRREDFIVIAAGYKGEIDQFVNANTGLASRFTWHIDFPDYNADDIGSIFAKLCEDADYKLSAEAMEKLRAGIRDIARREGKRFSNGRTARKLFETTLRAQAERLIRDDIRDKEALALILPEDIRFDHAVSDGSVTFLPKR